MAEAADACSHDQGGPSSGAPSARDQARRDRPRALGYPSPGRRSGAGRPAPASRWSHPGHPSMAPIGALGERSGQVDRDGGRSRAPGPAGCASSALGRSSPLSREPRRARPSCTAPIRPPLRVRRAHRRGDGRLGRPARSVDSAAAEPCGPGRTSADRRDASEPIRPDRRPSRRTPLGPDRRAGVNAGAGDRWGRGPRGGDLVASLNLG